MTDPAAPTPEPATEPKKPTAADKADAIDAEWEPFKSVGGRPRHVRTEENAKIVSVLRGCGGTQVGIAEALGISEPTLKAHYQVELDTGKLRTDARVVGALMKKIDKGDIVAILFYLKCKMGWKETNPVDPNALPAVNFFIDYGDGKGHQQVLAPPAIGNGTVIDVSPGSGGEMQPATIRESVKS